MVIFQGSSLAPYQVAADMEALRAAMPTTARAIRSDIRWYVRVVIVRMGAVPRMLLWPPRSL